MTKAPDELPEIAAQFYAAALAPELWADALDKTAAGFGAHGAILPGSSFNDRVIPHSRGMVPVLHQFFEQGWHLRDERTIAALRCDLISDIVTDQSLFSPETIARSPYYDGFARAAGVPWFCAVTLALDQDGGYLALSLQRSAAQGPFEAVDLARLTHLLPHLRNAATLARRLARSHAEGLLDGLNRAGTPALIVSHSGRILAVNARFEALHHPALRVTSGRLAAGRTGQQAALTALIEHPMQAQSPLILRAPDSGLPLILRAAPLTGPCGGGIGYSGTLLTLTDVTAPAASATPVLREVFGLTPREAQIMALIGAGHDLDRIACLLAIGRETVRFHLKSLFSKTGTCRQSELLSLSLRFGHS